MLHIVFICFAEMDDPEKELGALEHILVDANADPIALSRIFIQGYKWFLTRDWPWWVWIGLYGMKMFSG